MLRSKIVLLFTVYFLYFSNIPADIKLAIHRQVLWVDATMLNILFSFCMSGILWPNLFSAMSAWNWPTSLATVLSRWHFYASCLGALQKQQSEHLHPKFMPRNRVPSCILCALVSFASFMQAWSFSSHNPYHSLWGSHNPPPASHRLEASTCSSFAISIRCRPPFAGTSASGGSRCESTRYAESSLLRHFFVCDNLSYLK